MGSRETILGRLKRATRAAEAPGLSNVPDSELFDIDASLASSTDGLARLFGEGLEALRGELFRVPSASAAAEKILELLSTAEEGGVLAQRSPLTDEVISASDTLASAVDPEESLNLASPDLSKYAVGISVCDFLVARTGSVVLRSNTAGGRRLSVLPPLHIVLARSAQLVPSLDAAFAGIKDDEAWSFATVITGPSRTADIEKILVLGAHGPKRLAVVLLED